MRRCDNVCLLTPQKPKRTRTSFFLDDELRNGLLDLKDRDGVPEAESMRRAIRAFLREKEIETTPVLTTDEGMKK